MSIVQIFDQTIPLVSGYSMRSKYITESLKKLGYNIDVYSSPSFYYGGSDDEINGVNYYRTSVTGWDLIKKIPILKERVLIDSVVKRINSSWDGKIKIVDAHSSVLNGIIGQKVASKHNVPLVYEIRAFWEDAAVDQGKTKEGSLRYKLTKNLETSIIKKADKVTVICEGLKKDVIDRGIDPDKVHVIPNGVDIDMFEPLEPDMEIIEKYALKDHKVFGFIGSFFLFEGLDILVKAAKEIMLKRNDVKFLIVGGGRQENMVKELIERFDLQDKVILVGRVKHNDVKRYYSVIDCLVYPRISKRITELVTPLKPLEAMALEKSVIASDVGGLRELVTDGENGLLFKADDVDELVERCIYVLDNFENMKKLGKDSREYVIRERNWFDICKRYINIFKELGVSI